MCENQGSRHTAAGGSDSLQLPAAGSEQAGSRRSSSSNRRDVEVANLAPTSLTDTGDKVDEQLIEDVVWDQFCDYKYIVTKIRGIIEEVQTFCKENKNVHRHIKAWAVDLDTQSKAAEELGETVRGNLIKGQHEVRRARAVAEAADLSLSNLEASLVQSLSHSTPAKRTAAARKEEFEEVKARKKAKPKRMGRTTTDEERDGNERSRANADRPPKPDPGNRRAIRRAVSSKAVALVVKPGPGQSYASVASKLKAGVDVHGLGLDIRAMKKTANGDVRLQLARGPGEAEASKRLRAAVVAVLGDEEGTVTTNDAPVDLAVSDLDEETTAEEVREALRGQPGGDDQTIRVVRVVPGFGGGRTAIIKVPRRLGLLLDKEGRLLVGLVRCRVRLRLRPSRCYRCHGYGHYARECRGPDRSGLCLSCGGADHRAVKCTAPPHCVVCGDRSLASDHYPGSGRCAAYRDATRAAKKS